MPVATAWPDARSAFGSIAGFIVAGISIVVALRASRQARDSAADSKRSADASEQTAGAVQEISDASTKALDAATTQLEIAAKEHERLEAERERRPIIDQIELTDVVPAEGDEPALGVFRIAFVNSGSRDLTNAHLTVLFVRGSATELLLGRWGSADLSGARDETRERWPGPDGVPLDLDYVVTRVSGERGIHKLLYVRVPRRGTFPIRVRLFHADLQGGGPWVDARIRVADDGRATVEPITSDDPNAAFEGRCDELDRD